MLSPSRSNRFLLSGFALIVLLVVLPAAAQGTRVEPVIIDGVNHAIEILPDTPERQVQLVRRVLDGTLSRFSSIFGIPSPSIGVRFTHEAPPHTGTLAAAGPRRNASDPFRCYISIYDQPENLSANSFRFTLAHEIAHCFQFEVNSAAAPALATAASSEPDPTLWWVEGTAEWLAAQIYLPIGNPIEKNVREFYMISNQSPLIYKYENYWFFAFYATTYGEIAMRNFMRTVPGDEAGQLRFLNSVQATPDMMQRYARLIQRRALRYQPTYPPAGTLEQTPAALPYAMPIQTPQLSVMPVRVTVPAPSVAGNGIAVKITSGWDNGYRALLPDGTPIDSAGVTVCGRDLSTTLLLTISRGADPAEAGGEITFSEAPCVSDKCFAGEWAIYSTQYEVGDIYAEIEPTFMGEATLTIDEDGSMSGDMVGTQPLSNGFVVMNAPIPFHGSFTPTGRPVDLMPGVVLVPITTTARLSGTATGSGGTVDGEGTWTFYESGMTAPLRFPSYHVLECGNMTRTADGTPVYNYLFLYEATLEDLQTGFATPSMEMVRVGSF